MALWIASPPTCRVRTPRESVTAMDELGFLADKGNDAQGGEEGERGGGEDRHVVAAERIEGHAGEPRADQRAEAGAGVEAADDAGHGARAVEVHDDGRAERDVGAVADAEYQRKERE